jgi:hypothetical protein
MSREDDRRDLIAFLQQAEELLGWFVFDEDSGLSSDLAGPWRAAWSDTPSATGTRGRFTALAAAVASGNLDKDLESSGLSGLELQAKLRAFRSYYDLWSKLRDDQLNKRPRRSEASQVGGGTARL